MLGLITLKCLHQFFVFRFPSKDKNPDLLVKWIAAVRRQDWQPSKYSKLCSEHFTEQDYQIRPAAAHPLLKQDAVPTLFAAHPKHLQVLTN